MKKLFNLFGFGLTRVFEGDENNNANNSNTTGGDDTNKGGGGGGSGDKGQQKTDETYEIKVDKETRRVTLEEMRNLAQKAAGADKKFQEASDLRKSAEDGLRLKELVGRLSDKNHTPTESEVRELAGMVGANPDEFAAYLSGNEGDDDDDPNKRKGKQTGMSEDEFDRVFKERMGISPAEAKQREDYRWAKDIEVSKAEIRKLSDEAVDKDKYFGKIKIGEKAEDRISVIKEMVAEDVFRRIKEGEPFGAELRAASIQKIRAYVEKFGIPEKLDQHPIVLGLGPSGGLPAEVNSEEPIQRISSTDEKGEHNFITRYLQKGLKIARDAQRR